MQHLVSVAHVRHRSCVKMADVTKFIREYAYILHRFRGEYTANTRTIRGPVYMDIQRIHRGYTWIYADIRQIREYAKFAQVRGNTRLGLHIRGKYAEVREQVRTNTHEYAGIYTDPR